ncbi:MAG: hypothetical protein ACYTJ0_13985 [Planctomycetota bacterium]|jgi:hypothetical protein
MSGDVTGTTVTLRALAGQPLEDEAVHDMVVATARAIAERQGVAITDLHTAPDRIVVTLAGGRIEAIGFAAELRRLTGRWYTHKFGGELWGELADA